jgi:DUF971 family protein
VKPKQNFGKGGFELAGWQTVGGYAIQPRWGDGHNSGLYSYAFLRSLGALTGFVMCEQVKSLDFRSRGMKLIERAPQDVLEDVLSIIDASVF